MSIQIGEVVNQEFGTSSYSLNDFSTKIENGKFKLKGNESMLRYKTIYHMAKALSQTISTWVPDNLGKKDRSIYKDETTPLWLEISNAIDSCETIQEVNEFFSENSDLSYWISEQLKSTSYIAKFSQSTVTGWKELIESNRATEMHKFALILKEKQDWAKNLQHIPINSMPESDLVNPDKKNLVNSEKDIIDLYISCYEVLKLDFDENILILYTNMRNISTESYVIRMV